MTGTRLMHSSELIYVSAHAKGQISQSMAQIHFTLHGWQVSIPTDPASPYDLIIVHPKTNCTWRVQVKTVSSKKLTIKTYATGAGNLKGGKRKKVSYSKLGIDYIIGVDIAQSLCHLYPLDFYKTRQSINVKKHPTFPTPFIREEDRNNFDKMQGEPGATLATLNGESECEMKS